MSYVIMTATQWKDKLIRLARSKSDYRAVFPYNLLYWTGERWSADCNNLEKALFNGRDIDNPAPGSYAWPLPATGDATEYALYIQCSDRSADFTKLKLGEPRCLYMKGHFGAYLGEEWDEPGQGIVNCVESTPAWEDGIQFSYIAPNGARSWCKGGTIRGYWEGHGLASKWVNYEDKETNKVIETAKTETAPEVKGQHYGTADLAVAFIRNKFGNGYQNRLNNCLKEGYTEAEVRAAQDKTNEIVQRATLEKSNAELQVVICTAAYDCIAGKYGDGKDRKALLSAEYGAQTAEWIQNKIEEIMK